MPSTGAKPGWRSSLAVLAIGLVGLAVGCLLAASLPTDSLGANLAGLAAVAAVVPGLILTFMSAARSFRRSHDGSKVDGRRSGPAGSSGRR